MQASALSGGWERLQGALRVQVLEGAAGAAAIGCIGLRCGVSAY